jgi:serine/threonine protein kinase
MVGTTLSHYRIIEKLGQGGMGVVYKAQDTRLNRFVVLPTDSVSDPDCRRRFVQEARAASALNHPNIIASYQKPREPWLCGHGRRRARRSGSLSFPCAGAPGMVRVVSSFWDRHRSIC